MPSRSIHTELPAARADAAPATDDPDASFPAHLRKYRGHIQCLNLSEARQRELLEALWLIVKALVEHSFNQTSDTAVERTPRAASQRCKE